MPLTRIAILVGSLALFSCPPVARAQTTPGGRENDQYREINFGFRLCRREIVLKYLRSCREMPTMINAELVLLATMGNEAVREVTVHHRPRLYGSRQGFTGPMLEEAVNAFLALLRIRRNDVTKTGTSTIEAETRP